MSIFFQKQGNSLIVYGKTFLYKETIKALGGKFNGIDKVWILPLSDETVSQIEKLCSGSGKALASPAEELALPKSVDVLTKTPLHPEAPLSEHSLTIAELLARAQLAIQSEFRGGVWVVGEIENLTPKNGTLFLNLAAPKSEGSQVASLAVKAVLWSDQCRKLIASHSAETIGEIFQDGMKVRCFCVVTLFKDRGALSLNIIDVDPAFTRGSLAIAREALLKKLRQLGLDELNKQKKLPLFPFRIGLISAENSRAASDFLDQLFGGGFPGEVIFAPTPMQGDSVPLAVSASIERLMARDCDLIVMTRGGGGASDLRWFDAPEIAFAIVNASVPIVAAIGHHEDRAIAEEIAFRREKTPTAAADYILTVFSETRRRIEGALTQLNQNFSRCIEHEQLRHSQLKEALTLRSSDHLTQQKGRLQYLQSHLMQRGDGAIAALLQHLTNRFGALSLNASEGLARRAADLAKFEIVLAAKDPKPWIAEGWTQLIAEKRAISHVKDLSLGMDLSARLIDGKICLTVKEISHVQTDEGIRKLSNHADRGRRDRPRGERSQDRP